MTHPSPIRFINAISVTAILLLVFGRWLPRFRWNKVNFVWHFERRTRTSMLMLTRYIYRRIPSCHLDPGEALWMRFFQSAFLSSSLASILALASLPRNLFACVELALAVFTLIFNGMQIFNFRNCRTRTETMEREKKDKNFDIVWILNDKYEAIVHLRSNKKSRLGLGSGLAAAYRQRTLTSMPYANNMKFSSSPRNGRHISIFCRSHLCCWLHPPLVCRPSPHAVRLM